MHTYIASTHTYARHFDTFSTRGASTLVLFYRNKKNPILSFEISNAIVLENKLGCEKPDFTKVISLCKNSFDTRCPQMCLRCVYKIKALFQVTSTEIVAYTSGNRRTVATWVSHYISDCPTHPSTLPVQKSA